MEITYYVACSLDGFIADLQGKIDWLRPFEQSGDDYGYATFLASVDSILLGRSTYDFCLSLPEWPYTDKPTWVFSHSPLTNLPPNCVATSDSPSAVVEVLRTLGHRQAYLVGGGRLAASFRAVRFITRYIVSIVPVILGQGLPMIAPRAGLDRLEFVRSQAFDTGIVQVEYRAA